MLSIEALRRIGACDRESIESSVRLLFEKWAQGDIDGLAKHLAPDVAFPSNGFWTGVTPPLRGRQQVVNRLRAGVGALENIVSVIHEIVIDGDRAVVHRTAVGRRRDDGRRYQCDFIDFFRFRDGLVVEFSEYPDAAWAEIEPAY